MEEKLNELMEDPSFQEAFSKTASAEEASALFAQHGIQITPEELIAALTPPEGELNESELDGVAGGTVDVVPIPDPVAAALPEAISATAVAA